MKQRRNPLIDINKWEICSFVNHHKTKHIKENSKVEDSQDDWKTGLSGLSFSKRENALHDTRRNDDFQEHYLNDNS